MGLLMCLGSSGPRTDFKKHYEGLYMKYLDQYRRTMVLDFLKKGYEWLFGDI